MNNGLHDYSLSQNNMKELPFHKYDHDFTFIVNGKQYYTNRIVADLLSPYIRQLHYIDFSINEFYLTTKQTNDENIMNHDYFSEFLSLASFENIQIDQQHQKYYSAYFYILGNIEEYTKLQPNYTQSLTIDNVVDRLQSISEVTSIIMFDANPATLFYQEIIEFAASHFEELDKNGLKKLSIEILEEILRSEKLKLNDEDSLLKFVLSLYKEDNSYSVLFDYVDFKTVREETFEIFMKEIEFEFVNNGIWHSIRERIIGSNSGTVTFEGRKNDGGDDDKNGQSGGFDSIKKNSQLNNGDFLNKTDQENTEKVDQNKDDGNKTDNLNQTVCLSNPICDNQNGSYASQTANFNGNFYQGQNFNQTGNFCYNYNGPEQTANFNSNQFSQNITQSGNLTANSPTAQNFNQTGNLSGCFYDSVPNEVSENLNKNTGNETSEQTKNENKSEEVEKTSNVLKSLINKIIGNEVPQKSDENNGTKTTEEQGQTSPNISNQTNNSIQGSASQIIPPSQDTHNVSYVENTQTINGSNQSSNFGSTQTSLTATNQTTNDSTDQTNQSINIGTNQTSKPLNAGPAQNIIANQINNTQQQNENVGSQAIKDFLHEKGKEFWGIMRYLTNKTGKNIHNNKTIEITSNSVYWNNYPMNLVDYKSENFYQSLDVGGATVCFDFKDRSIQLTSYAIQSLNRSENGVHLKNWVIEVSNDKKKWIEIDRHQNDSRLNGPNFKSVFIINNPQTNFYRFIRLRQIGQSWYECSNHNYFAITYIEFYGKLKEPSSDI